MADAAKMIELNPKNADGYISRGSAYAKKKEYDQAIADFNKAITLNPKSAEAYADRASAHSKISTRPDMTLSNKRLHLSAAIGDAGKAVQLDPTLKKELDEFLGKARAKLAEME